MQVEQLIAFFGRLLNFPFALCSNFSRHLVLRICLQLNRHLQKISINDTNVVLAIKLRKLIGILFHMSPLVIDMEEIININSNFSSMENKTLILECSKELLNDLVMEGNHFLKFNFQVPLGFGLSSNLQLFTMTLYFKKDVPNGNNLSFIDWVYAVIKEVFNSNSDSNIPSSFIKDSCELFIAMLEWKKRSNMEFSEIDNVLIKKLYQIPDFQMIACNVFCEHLDIDFYISCAYKYGSLKGLISKMQNNDCYITVWKHVIQMCNPEQINSLKMCHELLSCPHSRLSKMISRYSDKILCIVKNFNDELVLDILLEIVKNRKKFKVYDLIRILDISRHFLNSENILILYSLMLKTNDEVVGLFPLLFGILGDILDVLRLTSNLKMITSFERFLATLTSPRFRSDSRKFAPTLISNYINFVIVENTFFLKSIKSSIFCLMDLCSEKDFEGLSTRLNGAGKQVFKNLFLEHQSIHKYKGNA
jgi:hypothetical protein